MSITSRAHIRAVLEPLRKRGKKVVFTNGCFDLLHVGHVRYLGEAKRHGDILVVGLNSDSSVRKIKGPTRPFVGQEDRAEILDALDAVDYVVLFDEPTPRELIRAVRPDVLIKGSDYAPDEIVGAGLLKDTRGTVVTVPLVSGRSTTALAEKIRKALDTRPAPKTR